MYTVYILLTDKGTYYTGQTNDLEARLDLHRQGKGAKYFRTVNSFELAYSEEFKTRSEALKREIEIKKLSHARKKSLVMRTYSAA